MKWEYSPPRWGEIVRYSIESKGYLKMYEEMQGRRITVICDDQPIGVLEAMLKLFNEGTE